MDKYEKMAEKLKTRIIENNGTVEVTPEEAMKIMNYLLGMSRIKKIIESEYGGVDAIAT